ncbi:MULTISPECIES: phosphate ABC transporter substrate-binding protein PstS [unclassified Acinetobacter]|uniref:phosphate ABC transporter substrate-binding protein PstS n=1 Tax=unclassified Acinetobacter TaxID=196816 RepID=UPI0035B8F3C0
MNFRKKTLTTICATTVVAIALVGCGNKQNSTTPGTAGASSTAGSQQPVTAGLTGAGASFPQPVYVQWAQAFKAAKGAQINYQSIGSSGGVKQITSKTVDFGATDAPMSPEDLEKNGLVQFPTVIGGVVPIIHVDGIKAGELKLTGEVLAGIYLGKIAKWNDPAIVALNPDLKLPDANITTVFRADGSGTSFIFTQYLSDVSADWKSTVGAANTVKWPTTNTGTAGKGNEGVATFVNNIKNSIGYVEYAYAKQNNMAHAQLKNAAGQFVQPTQESFAAAAKVDWAGTPGFGVKLTNSADAQAWPIASATFILMQKQAIDAAKSKGVLDFFEWVYSSGDDAAKQLDYVPLPAEVKTLVRAEWKKVVDNQGKPLVP